MLKENYPMGKLNKKVKALIGVGTVLGMAPDLIDNLLVHRKFDLPEGLKTAISGSDMTDLHQKGQVYEDWIAAYPKEEFRRTTADGV